MPNGVKNTFQIFRQNDKESAAAEAGENLNLLLEENKKIPILLLLSAGSSLSVLDYVDKKALGANLTLSMLDERFSQDSEINNFLQLQKKDFYAEALDAEVSFFGTLPRHEDTMEAMAERWEKNLRAWRQENPAGLIIATFGLGGDGHTAGIFGDDDEKKFNELFNGQNWITAYNVDDKNKFTDRVTTTITFLKMVNIGLAYVCSADKKSKLQEVAAKKGKPNQLPALIWHEIKDFRVFSDINFV